MRIHVTYDSCSGADYGILSDANVIFYPCLACQDHAVAYMYTAGDADLCDHYTVLADLHVMCYVHEVVYLCPSTDLSVLGA